MSEAGFHSVGISLDGGCGFPAVDEYDFTLIVTTVPGWHVGCISNVPHKEWDEHLHGKFVPKFKVEFRR